VFIDSSEFLRANHSHEQVDEQQKGNDAHDKGFHIAFLEFFAKTDVETAQGKKCHDNADEYQVTHKISAAAELSTRFRSWRYGDSVAGGRLIKI